MFLIPAESYSVKKIGRKGRGVFARHDIPTGTVIGDYSGKIVRSKDEDELRDGLYTMYGSEHFDILASPKDHGVHLMNHSCANNTDIYPYHGHMLFVATRHIFAGEEITINYMIGKADATEKKISCLLHACHCGSKLCTGSMHDNEYNFDGWDQLMAHESGAWQKKMPGKYGEQLPPLNSYPSTINVDAQKFFAYNAFGSEKKSPAKINIKTLPSLTELRKHIRKTGKRLAFPAMHLLIDGIRNNILLAEHI